MEFICQFIDAVDASFDVVISNGGFCLCPDKRRAFAEIFRVLRPGGRIAIACTVNRTALPSLASEGALRFGRKRE